MRALAAAVLLWSCSGGDGDTCPNDLPASCPSTVPSYSGQVAGIFSSRCVRCHGPGGVEAVRSLDTYDGVYRQRSAVLNRVYSCFMPPVGQPQPTASERAALLDWLVCDAPQN